MKKLIIREYSSPLDYQTTFQQMKAFTEARQDQTNDELWLLQHEAVLTQGQAGKPEHILNPHHIPIVQTDRGGQVTYHGPGQLMIYALLNLRRLDLSPRQLVCNLQNLILEILKELSITGHCVDKAPGVYVDGAKIASIGMRIRRGCCYHGVAFNIDMDLTPFSYINPCGFKNLKMTQVKAHNPEVSFTLIHELTKKYFIKQFGFPPNTEGEIISE